MVKRQDSEYRTAILNAFNQKPIQTIKDIIGHLAQTNYKNKSYHSVANMARTLVREGLLKEVTVPSLHNEKQYTRTLNPKALTLLDMRGNQVSLRQFVHAILDESSAPKLLSDPAWNLVKEAVLNSLGTTYLAPYEQMGVEIPSLKESEAILKEFQKYLDRLNRFTSVVLTQIIKSEAIRQVIGDQFRVELGEEHTIIRDEVWKNADDGSNPESD